MFLLSIIGIAQIAIVSFALRQQYLARIRNALYGYAILLSVISLVSYRQSIELGSALEPYLMESDGQRYFAQAIELADGHILGGLSELRGNYFGYQVILAFAFDLLSQDLFVGLLLNNTILLLTVILLAKTTLLITRDPGAAFYASLAFMLTARFIFYANVLLKEPFLCLGVALLIYSFAQLKIKRHTSLLAYAGLAAATVIFGTMRIPMLVLLPLGGILLLGRDILRKGWPLAVVGVLVAASLMTVFASFTTHEFTGRYVERVTVSNTVLDKSLDGGIDAGGVVGRVMSGYTNLPLPVRIVTVPIPAIIQYVLPFDFWSTKFLEDHVISLFNTNLNIVWYLFVGVFALYTIFEWRRLPMPILQDMFLAGGAMYLLIAFIFGGAVPRYASPYFLFIFPTIGYWMNTWRLRGLQSIKLNIFFRLYLIGLSAAGAAYVLFKFSRSA